MLFRGPAAVNQPNHKRCSFTRTMSQIKKSILKIPSYPVSPAGIRPARGKAYRWISSLTVECALTLPLFLMAVLIMLSVIDLTGALTHENLRLSNEARKAASVRALAGGDALEWIDLSSGVTPSISFSAFPTVRIRAAARARVRSYIGFSADDFTLSGDDGAGGETRTVYVTEYESVYHTNPDCTHLDLTVYKSDTASVGSLRNAYGKRYRKCDGFPAGYTGTVYVTAKGDRYYPSPDYAGLQRHVRMEALEDLSGLCECSRCRETRHAS